LIDGGGSRDYDVGKKILMPYLLKNGVKKIDVAFVSHRHLDHYGGLVSLAKNFNIEKLCFYDGNKAIEQEIIRETGLKKEQIIYLVKGQAIKITDDIFIEALYPEKKTEEEYEWLTGEEADENEISLILKVYYQGVSVLMTGDLGINGERSLIEACAESDNALKSDILKISHHGSKYSSSNEFLAAVEPKYAVIQVGKNGFGHPTGEVLEKCAEIGAKIYRNDNHGAIGVLIKNGMVSVKTVLARE
jgi:competence protein ComEC